MRFSRKSFQLICLLLINSLVMLDAHSTQTQYCIKDSAVIKCDDLVQKRAALESLIPLKYIGIAFYKPNYIMPFYYTGSPYYSIYQYQTPYNEQIKKTEIKYQASFKLPIWKNIFNYDSSFFFGYTLMTYWQVYDKYPFIRETNYEPELFFSNNINQCMLGYWKLDFFNYGYNHQSNGQGGYLERSWDRLFIEAITSIDKWRISFKPWYILIAYGRNANIANYLGYASFLVSYSLRDQVISVEIPNIFANVNHTSVNLTWSIPITNTIKFYAEAFSGYGQSLIEYNHRTNSVGVGFAVSDWL